MHPIPLIVRPVRLDLVPPCWFSQFRLLYLAILFALAGFLLVSWQMPTLAQAATCTGAGITGAVYRDYNADGSRGATEPGIAGIIVTAYDAGGGSASCETDANGLYGINPAGAYPVRLEFTLPSDGSLNFLRPGAKGSGSQTSVTFVNGPTANVNVGFNHPSQYCGATLAPDLVASCMVFGEQNDNPDGVNKNLKTLVSFPYNAGSTNLADNTAMRLPAPTSRALAKEIGTVWGLAWNPANQTLYAAAFMKRHAGFGPGGPGAIYQITASGPSLFHNFGALAGADPHPQPGQTCLSPGHNANNTNGNCWLNDSNSFDQVGKVGFGDLDISEDYTTLYAVNLAAKTLMAIPLANPGGATSFAAPTPTNCPATDIRPFGLAVNDGKVYLGMVCTGESTQNRTVLRAYIYTFANGAFSSAPVLEFPLTYDRGSSNLQWQYWLNRTTFNPTNSTQSGGKWAQPWLNDIVFDNGAMILGLRDRDGDLLGVNAGGPDPNDRQNYSAFSRGDILRACPTDSGGWALETNGSCGGVTTGGAGNGQGPGGGEFYFQDQQVNPPHPETALGGLAQVPGLPDVVSLVYNPIETGNELSDGGVKWINNTTGTTSHGYLIYDGSGETALFDKANGLGDIEAMCPLAPIEIGNRIWRDENGDGVQDASEPGLDGVTVELYFNSVLVATTTTNSSGEYLFSNANVPGGINITTCGGAPIYEIRIPNASGLNQQAPLAGLTLTGPDRGGATNGDLRDSDGSMIGAHAVFSIPCADLSSPGANNHTYDFGFTPAVPVATYSLGNYVWIDANNNGVADAGEQPVPNGVVVELLDGNGAPTSQTTTTTNGFYLFANLTAGSYRIRLAASNFQAGGLLAGYSSSTGAGQEATPDNNGDQNDNGLDGSAPATDGIASATVTLGSDEPTGETPSSSGIPGNDGLGTPDANSNLTVDFGVIPPPPQLVAVGNFIFRDLNNNGIFEPGNGETGVDGVTVELFVNGQSAAQASTTSANGGFYQFDNLQPGQSLICIPAANFTAGGPLADYTSSTGAGGDAPVDQTGDENGVDNPAPATNGICSSVIDLQPNSEPTGESQSNYTGVLDDDNVNFTVDFGFVPPPELVAIGNVIFRDLNKNGRFEPTAGEIGIDGVAVGLFRAGQDPVIEQPLATTTTTNGGFYLFNNLQPGAYFVHVQVKNFQQGAVLFRYFSSPGAGLSETIDDNLDENGLDENNASAVGIRTIVYNLAPNSEPITEAGAGAYTGALDDDNVNFTADFGFYKPLALGNRVWFDNGEGGGVLNNGQMDGGERGVPNVLLKLLDGVGSPIVDEAGLPLTTRTDGEGYYLFDNLRPGNYQVCVDASNFSTTGALRGLTNSGPTEADPNGDGDSNDNGINNSNPGINGICSGILTLAYDNEPVNEVDLGPVGAGQDAASNNLTVDFGFLSSPTGLEETNERGITQIFVPLIVRSR